AGALPGAPRLRRAPRCHGRSLASGGAQRARAGGRRADDRSARGRCCRRRPRRSRPFDRGADAARPGAGRCGIRGRRGARGRARQGDGPRRAQLRHARGCQGMTRIVQKYGGTSVATPGKLRLVARRVRESLRNDVEAVVVVSAMGDTTDELIALAHQVTSDPPSREMDMLLSAGETISAPLLAMALEAAGTAAVSLT